MSCDIDPFTPSHPQFDVLCGEAREEGYRFIKKLETRWADGSDRFELEGEVLLSASRGGVLLGVGGLNRDPYGAEGVGRLRHVYIRQPWRGQNVGQTLVHILLDHARLHFPRVRLNAADAKAAAFYEHLGFLKHHEDRATHSITF